MRKLFLSAVALVALSHSASADLLSGTWKTEALPDGSIVSIDFDVCEDDADFICGTVVEVHKGRQHMNGELRLKELVETRDNFFEGKGQAPIFGWIDGTLEVTGDTLRMRALGGMLDQEWVRE